MARTGIAAKSGLSHAVPGLRALTGRRRDVTVRYSMGSRLTE